MSEIEEYVPTTKEWEGVSHERTVQTRLGQRRKVVISSFARSTENAIHMKDKRHGLYFDVPCDGDYNLVLSDSETNNPLGVASIDFKYGIPLVTMIQKVSAHEEVAIPAAPKSPVRFDKIYSRIEHPQRNLIQGDDKLPWEEVLLEECEEAVKSQGYNRLRIYSGFRSEYIVYGHKLHMAIQQYDYLVKDDEDWEPLGPTGIKYSEREKKDVASMVTWVRNKKIYRLKEVEQRYPNTLPPGYYEKKLA